MPNNMMVFDAGQSDMQGAVLGPRRKFQWAGAEGTSFHQLQKMLDIEIFLNLMHYIWLFSYIFCLVSFSEWALTISAGVDPVLMFAVIMIVDELRDQRRNE